MVTRKEFNKTKHYRNLSTENVRVTNKKRKRRI